MISDEQWKKMAPVPMLLFHERYVLHDSGFVGGSVDPMGFVYWEIQFDLHWNPDIPSGYDRLWLRFDEAYSFEWKRGGHLQSTIDSENTTILSREKREEVASSPEFNSDQWNSEHWPVHPRENPALALTTLQLMNWGTVKVLHGEPVRIALESAAGDVIDLTELKA